MVCARFVLGWCARQRRGLGLRAAEMHGSGSHPQVAFPVFQCRQCPSRSLFGAVTNLHRPADQEAQRWTAEPFPDTAVTPCWGKLHPPGQQTGLKVSTGRSLHSRPEEIAELPGGMRPEVYLSSSHTNRQQSSPDPQILRQDALDHQQGDLPRPLLAGRRGARCRESIVVQPLFENTCKGYRYQNLVCSDRWMRNNGIPQDSAGCKKNGGLAQSHV